jgi:putative flippase GtrA
MGTVRRLLQVRILRFGVVAGACTLLQLGLMLALIAKGIDSVTANGIGFVVSAQVNFVLSIVFTYRDRRITWSSTIIVTRWIPFNATALCALAINEVVFTLCVQQHLAHVPAALCGAVSGSIVSFTIGNKAIFSSEEGNSTMYSATLAEVDQQVVNRLQQEGIAFFLPAYNEAENLRPVVTSIFNFFAAIGCPFTIFIVNDGSTDGTDEVARQLEQLYGTSRVVAVHQLNQGYGGALRTGINAALETTHGLIGFCDSDGQFDIADSNRLIRQLIEHDADLAIGIRTQRADSLKRRLMGRGWHKLSRVLLDYDATDVDCGFKVFGRHVLEKISPQLSGDHAVVSPEILSRVKRAGFEVTEIAVNHKPRAAGEQTGANLKVVWRSLVQIFQLRRLINQEG